MHVIHGLGLHPEDKPSPQVVAASSFFTFSLGALVPGAVASLATSQRWW